MSTCVFVIMKLSFLENLGDVLLRVFQKYKDTPRVSPNTEEHTSHATFVLPELAARGAFPSFSVFFALAILPLPILLTVFFFIAFIAFIAFAIATGGS